MKLWDLIKLSVLHLLVHMELSLCLSFYRRHCLGGYTVVTTTGFTCAHNLTAESHGSAHSTI
jgi:hypothetical protein